MVRQTGLEPALFQLCAFSLGKSAITAAKISIFTIGTEILDVNYFQGKT